MHIINNKSVPRHPENPWVRFWPQAGHGSSKVILTPFFSSTFFWPPEALTHLPGHFIFGKTSGREEGQVLISSLRQGKRKANLSNPPEVASFRGGSAGTLACIELGFRKLWSVAASWWSHRLRGGAHRIQTPQLPCFLACDDRWEPPMEVTGVSEAQRDDRKPQVPVQGSPGSPGREFFQESPWALFKGFHCWNTRMVLRLWCRSCFQIRILSVFPKFDRKEGGKDEQTKTSTLGWSLKSAPVLA